MADVTQSQVGSVVSLWRYPVKSMQGEELNATAVTERGLLGDRAYALVDAANGKVVSAKNPRKWPAMFDFRAGLAEAPHAGGQVPAVWITLPDGTIVTSEQKDISEVLSGVLGRQVTLSRAAPQAGSSKSIGPIWRASTTGTRLRRRRCPAGRSLTPPSCTC